MQSSTARVKPREVLARAARASDARGHGVRELVKEVLHQALVAPRRAAPAGRAWSTQLDNAPGLR
eukprot:2625912-Pyramimonas_sp.AAC.1